MKQKTHGWLSIFGRNSASDAPPPDGVDAFSAPWTPPDVTRQQKTRPRLPMMCSAIGGWITLLAEDHDTVLRVVGYEIPQAQQPGGGSTASLLSGEYRLEFPPGWACPLCGNDSQWVCECANLFGALHCQGNIGGEYHCACGGFGKVDIVPAEKVRVRAASAADRPGKTTSISERSQLDPKHLLSWPGRQKW